MITVKNPHHLLERVSSKVRSALDQGQGALQAMAPTRLPDVAAALHLAPDHQGPILVAGLDRTLDHEHNIADNDRFGAQDLLGDIASQNVPIVYLAEKRSRESALQFLSSYPSSLIVTTADLSTVVPDRDDAMQRLLANLRTHYPHAPLYVLGNDGGNDAVAAAAIPGTRAFLLNTDPTQERIPSTLKPVVTNQYNVDFKARVLSELAAAQAQANGQVPPPLAPLPIEPRPMPHYTSLDALRLNLHGAAVMAAGAGQKMAAWLSTLFASAVPVVQRLTRTSDAALAQETPAELALMADSLVMDKRLSASVRSQQLFRLLLAHGTEPGSIDAIQSRMSRRDTATQALQPAQRAKLDRIQEANRAIPGRWDLMESYLDRATLSAASEGNHIDVLINGPAAFKAMVDSIRGAHQFALLNTHVFQSDQAGYEHADAMQQARRQGAEVRALYDEFGSSQPYHYPTRPNDPAFYDGLKQAGIHLLLHKSGPMLDHLTHRKILSVDAGQRLVAYLGGMNIADEHRDVWHDVQCRITGPAVTAVNQVQIDQWAEMGEPLSADLQARMLAPQAPVEDGARARIIQHTGHKDINMKLAYLRAIDTAEKSINIADPYFTDPDVYQHLMAAARRGVAVQVFYPRHNIVKLTQDAARSWFPPMIQAGIKVFEYDGLPMSHGKVATFDGLYTTIGSSNLDGRSLLANDECNVWSADAKVAQDMDTRFFGPDVAHSVAFPTHTTTLEEHFARLVSPLL